MEIKPVTSDRNYRRALKKIDRLMDARPNTDDGERLDMLTTLVQTWEQTHYAIDAPR